MSYMKDWSWNPSRGKKRSRKFSLINQPVLLLNGEVVSRDITVYVRDDGTRYARVDHKLLESPESRGGSLLWREVENAKRRKGGRNAQNDANRKEEGK